MFLKYEPFLFKLYSSFQYVNSRAEIPARAELSRCNQPLIWVGVFDVGVFLLLCFQMQFWPRQYEAFDAMIVNVALEQQSRVQWVNCTGNPTEVSGGGGGVVANVQLACFVKNVTQARAVGYVEDLCYEGP